MAAPHSIYPLVLSIRKWYTNFVCALYSVWWFFYVVFGLSLKGHPKYISMDISGIDFFSRCTDFSNISHCHLVRIRNRFSKLVCLFQRFPNKLNKAKAWGSTKNVAIKYRDAVQQIHIFSRKIKIRYCSIIPVQAD